MRYSETRGFRSTSTRGLLNTPHTTPLIYDVIAPSDAECTVFAYFANTPRVSRGPGFTQAALRLDHSASLTRHRKLLFVGVDGDLIAVLEIGERAADPAFRGDVADDQAARAAGEAAVGDEADLLAESLA